MRYLVGFATMLMWLAGIVLAKGTASTWVAICVPPWAWFLVVERAMHAWGLT